MIGNLSAQRVRVRPRVDVGQAYTCCVVALASMTTGSSQPASTRLNAHGNAGTKPFTLKRPYAIRAEVPDALRIGGARGCGVEQRQQADATADLEAPDAERADGREILRRVRRHDGEVVDEEGVAAARVVGGDALADAGSFCASADVGTVVEARPDLVGRVGVDVGLLPRARVDDEHVIELREVDVRRPTRSITAAASSTTRVLFLGIGAVVATSVRKRVQRAVERRGRPRSAGARRRENTARQWIELVGEPGGVAHRVAVAARLAAHQAVGELDLEHDHAQRVVTGNRGACRVQMFSSASRW